MVGGRPSTSFHCTINRRLHSQQAVHHCPPLGTATVPIPKIGALPRGSRCARNQLMALKLIALNSRKIGALDAILSTWQARRGRVVFGQAIDVCVERFHPRCTAAAAPRDPKRMSINLVFKCAKCGPFTQPNCEFSFCFWQRMNAFENTWARFIGLSISLLLTLTHFLFLSLSGGLISSPPGRCDK